MSLISVRIDADQALAAFRAAPEVLARHVDGALARAAAGIAGEAKRRAPKSLSVLTNSIIFGPVGPLAYEVRPGVAYGAYVELGTGPAAGNPQYYPNVDNLIAYLTASPKARGFGRWKKGAERDTQAEQIAAKAQAFAWWIWQHGTRPQPYMAPAAEAKRDETVAIVRAAVDAGIAEAFGAASPGVH